MANYPWPSTVNFANFVTVRPWLNRNDPEGSINDYQIWKEQMLCLLEGQELLGFIDGQIPPPSRSGESTDHQEHKLWRRTDMLIKGWILGSLGNDTLASVANVGSSRDVWLKLENIFNQIRHNHNRIQNQIFDYPSNEGRGEAAAGGVRNDTVVDQDGIVELEPYTHSIGA